MTGIDARNLRAGLLPDALSLVVPDSLDALAIASQQHLHAGTRHDVNRVLVGQGLANARGACGIASASASGDLRYALSARN